MPTFQSISRCVFYKATDENLSWTHSCIEGMSCKLPQLTGV